jgi:hypothetical protein
MWSSSELVVVTTPTGAVPDEEGEHSPPSGWGTLGEKGREPHMAARRPRPRRWWVRRRHFLDAQGGQVTDTWLNIPSLPRRMLTTRSPDRRVSITTISGGGPPPVGCALLLAVLVLVALVWDVFRVVGSGQWVARIPDDLVILLGLSSLGSLTLMIWRARHCPE